MPLAMPGKPPKPPPENTYQVGTSSDCPAAAAASATSLNTLAQRSATPNTIA